ncbi:MAG: hypothetical protein V4643_10735 [Bacteroidota bacterium]
MNNFIIISRTFSEITPESAEIGDFSDNGFIDLRQEVTFTELVVLMRTHNNPSCTITANNYTVNTGIWFSTDFYINDYSTCTSREESIHFHSDNTHNAAKYWKLAFIAANK